ncbi:MAG: YgiQ family radical SAM protein [Methanohalobium sp.]|uniref:YgiQ family radical SAM protein n=1 Tax=Methanohalobium sp. TaxID=2837493 RepID=UPI003979BB22
MKKSKYNHFPVSDFLPTNLEDTQKHGWSELDIIIITGDAYVDHPGFGTAIIGRVLEDAGFRVGIIAQPDWNNMDDFKKLGKPRLFFAVTAGNTDSMVSNYTSSLKPRSSDVYSPGGEKNHRPNRATVVYTNQIKEAYPDSPIVIGGIEASLRRFAQYDYLSNKVRKSILADAPADILVYGMGELQTVEIARQIDSGRTIDELRNIDGTVWKLAVKKWKKQKEDYLNNYVEIPSYSEVSTNKEAYARAFKTTYQEQDYINGKAVVQPHPKTIIVQNKPMRPLTQQELDRVYELPFTREAHPSYKEPVPALDTVKFSINTHRGCFGNCSFCAITQHQGRIITSRSIDSIVREAAGFTRRPDFKGTISGVGGPSANMYGMECKKWKSSGVCKDKFCLYPKPCPSLDTNHNKSIEMLRQLRQIPGVSKVLIGYGIRHDLALQDEKYMEELCAHHVGGQLKVAPEHFSDRVTDIMRKPGKEVFEEFAGKFNEINKKLGKEQYLVSFLISGHPDCRLDDMIELAEYIRDTGRYTEQVQDFTPTPMTVSTCMFYTGLDPFTGKKVYIPDSPKEKRIHRALLQYKNPKNHKLVYEGLKKANRMDLIGNAWKCLISRRKNKK